MEVVPFLRALWRRRLACAVGALVALALCLVLGKGEPSSGGVASTRVALDTPSSQLIHADPRGADSLWWRAGLLADLMATEPVRRRIAADLRISSDELVVVSPPLQVPTVPASLPRIATEAAAPTSEPYLLTVRFDEQLPIISLEAAAPSRAKAARLVEVATGVLRAQTSLEDTGVTQGFIVESIAPVQASEVRGGPGRMLALAVSLVLFGLWCAGLALIPGPSRGRGRRPAGRLHPA